MKEERDGATGRERKRERERERERLKRASHTDKYTEGKNVRDVAGIDRGRRDRKRATARHSHGQRQASNEIEWQTEVRGCVCVEGVERQTDTHSGMLRETEADTHTHTGRNRQATINRQAKINKQAEGKKGYLGVGCRLSFNLILRPQTPLLSVINGRPLGHFYNMSILTWTKVCSKN